MTDIDIQTDKKRLEHAKAALYRQKKVMKTFEEYFSKMYGKRRKNIFAENVFLSQNFDQKYFLEQ